MTLFSMMLFALAPAVAAKGAPTLAVTPFPEQRYDIRPDGSLAPYGEYVVGLDGLFPSDKLLAASGPTPGKYRIDLAFHAASDGRVTDCHPVDADSLVGKRLCANALDVGPVPRAYEAPGRPVPLEWRLKVEWLVETAADREKRLAGMIKIAPPAPPSPTNRQDWPPRYFYSKLRVVSLPDLASYVPDHGPRKGVVGVLLTYQREREAGACEVRRSSGIDALDQAACRWAEAVRVKYEAVCVNCWKDSIPLQLLFDGRRSNVQLPSSDNRKVPSLLAIPSLSQREATELKALPITNWRPRFRVMVSADGKAGACNTIVSTGYAPVDQRLCRQLERSQWLPATSVFGQPMATGTTIPFNLLAD